MGIKYVEAYPGQTIGGEIDGKFHHSMDNDTRKAVNKMLNKKSIKLMNYGVVNGKSDDEWKQIFEFAKEMGIETIVCEPQPKFFDELEKLCDEYEINIAIHNHPIPSQYWHPDIALNYLKGRSKRMGLCADIGHWARSGLNPLECLQKAEGRIISVHMKDLNVFGVRKAHDVPWGTGVCNISGVMHEFKRQNFKGVFSVEYEYHWKSSVPEIAECVAYFNRLAHWIMTE